MLRIIEITDEKISEMDWFEFPAKTIFANNSKTVDCWAINDVYSCSKQENGTNDT